MEINPIKFQNNFNNLKLEQKTKKNEEAFSDYFKNQLNKVNNLQKESEAMTAKFAVGEVENVHDVMIAAEKAKVAVNLTTAVQTKVVDAYNEIMRLQL